MLHVSTILGYHYRASTWHKYHWFENCLNNEPRVGTLIRRSLVPSLLILCILTNLEEPKDSPYSVWETLIYIFFFFKLSAVMDSQSNTSCSIWNWFETIASLVWLNSKLPLSFNSLKSFFLDCFSVFLN